MNYRKLRDFFLIFLFGFALAKFIYDIKDKGKHLDLPEEWEEVKPGDTLKVYKINRDTIFIGFYNKANQEDRIY